MNPAMKSTKTRSKGRRGSEPSVLDYFSKSKQSKRTKASKSKTPPFGTPATPAPVVHHLVGDVGQSETPVSVVSDDALLVEPSRKSNPSRGTIRASGKHAGREERGTVDGSAPASSAVPDTHDPNTPLSPVAGSCLPTPTSVVLGGREGATEGAGQSETPPSNDACIMITTPPSPPTPDAWMDRLIDRKENKPNYTKLNPTCSYDGTFQNDSRRRQKVKKGTPAPATACAPSSSFAMPQSNDFFRNYSASASSKTRKTDQNTVCSKPNKKQRQFTNQLFLDFGQNSFGRQSICNICGMLRVHGMEEDDAQHAKICKEYREGVSCLGWKNERRVATFGRGDRILEVRSEDALQHHRKVLEVKAIVDRELGFASRKNEDPARAVASMTSYMYVSKKRVAGLLMVKRIQRAYKLLPSKEGDGGSNNNDNSSTSISRSLKSSKALLGVHQIWVHNSHRSKGIASKLVTAARDHLIFGMMVPLELVAFSSPTDEGLRFAKRYTGLERPLIYDIH